MLLHLKAKPNSSKNELKRLEDGTWQVRIKAPAQEGKANAELLAFLSKVFGVPKSSLELESGANNQFKRINIPLSDEEVQAILDKI